MRRLLVLCCLMLAVFPLSAAEPGSWQPDTAERTLLAERVDARWARVFPDGAPRPRATWQDFAGLALDGLAAGAAPDRVERALEALAALQDTDPKSPAYGNVRWYHGDEKVVDRNGVEFATRHAVLAWILYRDRLTAGQRKPLEGLLRLARVGIAGHRVAVSYTNIFLMKTWNMIALGEQFGDARLAEEGVANLRQWIAFTARAGITEYLSPDYYNVDLENLALIANLSANEEARALARRGLDIVWTDVALNWYRPAGRLAGPHSRSYDRLFNTGGLDGFAARAGWGGAGRRPLGPYAAYAWSPPSAAAGRWLDAPRPRFVSARFGEEPHQRYSHYIGDAVSIASAESNASLHDNALVINLGGGRDVPAITAFVDGRRDHYGMIRTLEKGSGHMKALHLKTFIASAQNGPEVLFLASAKDGREEVTAQETVVTLPADADFWLDGRPLDVFRAVSAWTPEPAPDGERTTLATVRRDGRIEVTVADRDASAGVGLAHYAPARPGSAYRLRATVQGGPVSLYLNFLDADRRLIGRESIKGVAGGPAFSAHVHEAVAPAGTAWCKAWLYSPIAARSEVAVRDLRFEDVAGGKVLAGFDFQEPVAQEIAVPAGATLVVRRQGAAAALRPVGAWDVERRPVPFVLVNDGLKHRALRLTATHSPARTEGRGAAALWAYAVEGLEGEAAFAAFLDKVQGVKSGAAREGDEIDVRANGLRLVADIARERRLVREGMAPTDPDAALSVDGKAVER